MVVKILVSEWISVWNQNCLSLFVYILTSSLISSDSAHLDRDTRQHVSRPWQSRPLWTSWPPSTMSRSWWWRPRSPARRRRRLARLERERPGWRRLAREAPPRPPSTRWPWVTPRPGPRYTASCPPTAAGAPAWSSKWGQALGQVCVKLLLITQFYRVYCLDPVLLIGLPVWIMSPLTITSFRPSPRRGRLIGCAAPTRWHAVPSWPRDQPLAFQGLDMDSATSGRAPLPWEVDLPPSNMFKVRSFRHNGFSALNWVYAGGGESGHSAAHRSGQDLPQVPGQRGHDLWRMLRQGEKGKLFSKGQMPTSSWEE